MSTAEAPNGIRVHTSRPGRTPPRNENGVIVCLHKECEGNEVTFRRPCEYNKHMDRHERPYKCSNSACDQNPGFTYSGGLLRHQREVHKMHLAKDPLYCPHSNCVRSSGAGFTRKENLEEHLRRRHPPSLALSVSSTSPTTTTITTKTDPVGYYGTSPLMAMLPVDRKRRRSMLAEEEDRVDDYRAYELAASESNSIIKRLKGEVARRDEIIVSQAEELQRLRQLVQPMRSQLIYQPMSSSTTMMGRTN